MSLMHPCHYCDEEIDVRVVFDADRGPAREQGHRRCPECHITLDAMEAIAYGFITPEQTEQHDENIVISKEYRAQVKEQREELEDPADYNQYTGEKKGEVEA